MDLTKLNNEIFTENACYEDLLIKADVFREAKDWKMARQCLKDAIKSINTLEELEKRKQLHTMPHYLNKIGVFAKVVKRDAKKI